MTNVYHEPLGSIPSCVTIDFLDMVASNVATGRLSLTCDEEYEVEWAGFPVEHLELHGVTRKRQSSGFFRKTVNVARIASLGVAHLVKFQWLILKTKFVTGRRSQKVAGMTVNVSGNRRVNHELVQSDVIIVSGNGNRISINRRSYKVPGVLEGRLVCSFCGLVAYQTTSVFGERCQQISPMCDEWQQGVSRNRDHRRDYANHVRSMRDEAGKDAALRYSLYIKTAALVSRITSVLVRDRTEGCGQIEQVKRVLVLNFDDHSCQRIAHILDPHRFAQNVNLSDEQFNGVPEVAA